MTENAIISSTHRKRYIRGQHTDGVTKSGLDLRMEDGSLWFHPFDGSTPSQLESPSGN